MRFRHLKTAPNQHFCSTQTRANRQVTLNTNGIMLMWPGAASTAQTIAGMVMEFRYCQFGQMATVDGEVTSKTPKQRVIAFGAQLSPDFLVPSNFDWSNRKTSAMEVAQLKMASSNYTPSQLRDVQEPRGMGRRRGRKSEFVYP